MALSRHQHLNSTSLWNQDLPTTRCFNQPRRQRYRSIRDYPVSVLSLTMKDFLNFLIKGICRSSHFKKINVCVWLMEINMVIMGKRFCSPAIIQNTAFVWSITHWPQEFSFLLHIRLTLACFGWQWSTWAICLCFYKFIILSLQVSVTVDNVQRLQLFEDDQPDSTLLALHPPDDPTQGLDSKLPPFHTHKG